MKQIYNIKIDLKSFELRQAKIDNINELIKNIELVNSENYIMRQSAKDLLMNNLFNLDIFTIKLLNIHLSK